jgi:hypothetical protein
MESDLKVMFKGNQYLLIGGNIKRGGPIATKEQFDNFECSFAYLHPDGNISRFGAIIGTRNDLSVCVDAGQKNDVESPVNCSQHANVAMVHP